MEAAPRRLNRNECLDHLATRSVGRVAVTIHALPAIIPVNYGMLGDAVVFRTESDGPLARACANAVVAFEVDEVAPDGSGGWSVLVVGVADQLSPSAELRANRLALVSTGAGGRSEFVAITGAQITGRRIRAVPHPIGAAAAPAGAYEYDGLTADLG